MVESIILEPGETVIFNNHRLLHGRESYKVPSVFGYTTPTGTSLQTLNNVCMLRAWRMTINILKLKEKYKNLCACETEKRIGAK